MASVSGRSRVPTAGGEHHRFARKAHQRSSGKRPGEEGVDVADRRQVGEAASQRGEGVRQHRQIAGLAFDLLEVVEAPDDLQRLLQDEGVVAGREALDVERVTEHVRAPRAEVVEQRALERGCDDGRRGSIVEERGEVVRERREQRILEVDDADRAAMNEQDSSCDSRGE